MIPFAGRLGGVERLAGLRVGGWLIKSVEPAALLRILGIGIVFELDFRPGRLHCATLLGDVVNDAAIRALRHLEIELGLKRGELLRCHGSTQTSRPSFTCQPGLMSFFLKLLHPFKVLPANSSFQPVAFSVSSFGDGKSDQSMVFHGRDVTQMGSGDNGFCHNAHLLNAVTARSGRRKIEADAPPVFRSVSNPARLERRLDLSLFEGTCSSGKGKCQIRRGSILRHSGTVLPLQSCPQKTAAHRQNARGSTSVR
jgi:hypothetical protein